MYSESLINDILNNNNIPAGASILNIDRDPTRTSEKYKTTDDVSVVKLLNDMGWFVTDYKQVKAHDADKAKYKKYLATYANPKLPHIAGKGNLTILAKNSKDGISSLEFFGGLNVWACLNGVVAGNHLVEPIKIRHKGDIPEQIDSMVMSMVETLPLIGEKVTEMSSRVLNDKEIIKLAKDATELRFGVEAPGVDINEMLRARRPHDNDRSLFSVFNRLQENIFRPDKMRYTRSDGKKTTARIITNVDQIVNLNRNLWDLAEQYLN